MPRISKSRLRSLVEKGTADAYDESEQAVGFLTALEDELRLPFETEVLGVAVTVVGIDMDQRDHLVAICRRGSERQAVGLLDLPLPSPSPRGWECIEAYRFWARGE